MSHEEGRLGRTDAREQESEETVRKRGEEDHYVKYSQHLPYVCGIFYSVFGVGGAGK